MEVTEDMLIPQRIKLTKKTDMGDLFIIMEECHLWLTPAWYKELCYMKTLGEDEFAAVSVFVCWLVGLHFIGPFEYIENNIQFAKDAKGDGVNASFVESKLKARNAKMEALRELDSKSFMGKWRGHCKIGREIVDCNTLLTIEL